MQTAKHSRITYPLKTQDFPIITEGGKPKAVIMDIAKFHEFELLVDNLIHLREEKEDELIAKSEILEKLMTMARQEIQESKAETPWEKQIDAI